jgi:hypothetical protein
LTFSIFENARSKAQVFDQLFAEAKRDRSKDARRTFDKCVFESFILTIGVWVFYVE